MNTYVYSLLYFILIFMYVSKDDKNDLIFILYHFGEMLRMRKRIKLFFCFKLSVFFVLFCLLNIFVEIYITIKREAALSKTSNNE